jgi:hypothetical protein
VRSDADLKSDVEIVSAQRALPEYGTGVEEGELSERHLQEALLASMKLRLRRVEANEMGQHHSQNGSYDDVDGKRTVIIPVPVIREVPAYSETLSQLAQHRFHKTEEYIDFDADDRLLLEREIDYEADEEDVAFAEHRLGIGLDSFERAMDQLEKEQGTSRNLLPFENMRNQLLKDNSFGLDPPKAQILYEHWRQKRERRRGEALLRYLRDPPNLSNTDMSVAFRPRNDEEQKRRARSNTFENYKRMRGIRQDMERVRTIMEQVMKRERLKSDHTLFSIAYQLAILIVRYPQLESSVRANRSLRLKTFGGIDLSSHLANLAELARKGALRWDAASGTRAEGKTASDHSGTSVTKIKVTMDAKPSESTQNEPMAAAPKRNLWGFDEKGFIAFQRIAYFTNGFFRDGISPYDWRVHELSRQAFSNPLANASELLHPLRMSAEGVSQLETHAISSLGPVAPRPRRTLRSASVLITRLTTPMAYSILDAPAEASSSFANNAAFIDYRRKATGSLFPRTLGRVSGSRLLLCFPDSTPFCDREAALEMGFRPTLVRARKGSDQLIYLDRLTVQGTELPEFSDHSLGTVGDSASNEVNLPWPKRHKPNTR